MSAVFRYLIVTVLITTAFILATCFVEYRVQSVKGGGTEAPDFVLHSEGKIIPLGLTTLPPEKGTDLERYHGKISAERGVYAKHEYPVSISIAFGVFFPIVMVFLAIFLILKIR